FDLTSYNSYRVKAQCETAYFPENEEEAVAFFKENKDFILLGSGHNIIFSKAYYQKPMVLFNGNYNAICLNGKGQIEVETGAMMWDVAQFALDHELSGLE